MTARLCAPRLLEATRPPEEGFDPGAPAAQAALERILATPPAAPARPERLLVRRALVLAALGSATAVAGLALLPQGTTGPHVIASAAAALDEPETILHFKTERRDREGGPGHPAAGPLPAAKVDRTMEVWQTAGARREHVVLTGPTDMEWVTDRNAKVERTYVPARDEEVVHTDPAIFDDPASGVEAPRFGGGNAVGELSRLLHDAQEGRGDVHYAGESTVRGVPVYELRTDFVVQTVGNRGPQDMEPRPAKASRVLFIDRDTYLPVRIVEYLPEPQAGVVLSITDYVEMERLPLTEENERLLKMAPHPGAKVIVER
jgi:hypothetical protein